MRRLFALVIALVLASGPAFAATPPPHHAVHREAAAARARQPAARLPVGIALTAISPARYLAQGSTLRVRGQLLNQSETPYQQVAVRLRFGDQRLTSRGELETYSEGKGFDPPRIGVSRLLPAPLPVGGRQGWSLSLQVKRMNLAAFGVYPVSVESYAGNTVIGRQRFLVIYHPNGSAVQKTKIAWIWPVIDQPHRADDATFVDDRLERQFGSGRLAGLVAAAAHTAAPVSWLVDPGLVDDAARMAAANGYTIKGTAHRPRSVAAGAWLTALRNAVGADQLIATPYADPDVMALAQHRMGHDVAVAAAGAVPALGKAGLSGATTSVAMPPDGLADQQTLAALVAGGSHTLLLSSAALPPSQTQTFTPDPLTGKTISGTNVKLIAYDDTLRQVLSADTAAPGAAVVTEQRFLAETAMITGERPNHPRTVVVAPPRRWNPSPSFAKALLSYSSRTPWLQAVTLRDVESLAPVSRTVQPQRDVPTLSAAHLRQVRSLSARIRRFSSIFQPPDGGFTLGVARAESSAWSGQSGGGTAFRKALDAALGRATGKIRVLNRNSLLAGKSGAVALTVSNELAQGTVVVRLHAYSLNNTRLRVEGGDHLLTLQAGHKDQVTLSVKASANGFAYVNLELLAPDGRPFGKTSVLRVHATGYGRTALLITGVSLAVLFLGVGIRVVRRKGVGAEESID